ncbi:MAG: FAD-dependent oxidoreductase, partial [Chitinophagaceae bacterium]
MKKKILVVGNGMVGHKFCEKMKAKDLREEYQLLVIGEEPRRAYDRVHLSEYFSGKTAEDLSLVSSTWYRDNQIELYLDEGAVEIDRFKKTVTTASGRVVPYDFLILATGSSP